MRAREEYERRRAYLPLRELMHPTNPEFIEDEATFEDYDFWLNWGITMGTDSREMLDWRRDLPEWHKLDIHQCPRYTWMKAALQLLQWARPGERFFGKSIWHMENLSALIERFPDATIIVTHRDPVAVVQSLATMFAYRSRMYYTEINPEEYFEFYKAIVHQLAGAYLRDRSALPAGQVLDLRFSELREDQIGTIARVYEVTRFPLTDKALREIEQQRSHRVRGFVPVEQGRVVYDIRSDFGADPEAVRREFAYYTDGLQIEAEIQ